MMGTSAESTKLPRVEILGVGISAISVKDALREIGSWVETREKNYVCVNTVHSILLAQDDADLAAVYENAGLVTPDGMPLVWIMRARGHSRVERVYGPDLMLSCCDHFRDRGTRHYFYGGAEGIPDLLAERMSSRFPGLIVCGAYSPPFRSLSEEERRQDADRINDSAADIVWVGLGAPKQDHWMAQNSGLLDAPVLVGVGAAFDFHSGRKKQAPPWMRRAGLEWGFRLATEPRRLAGRYLVGNPKFLALLAIEQARRRFRADA